MSPKYVPVILAGLAVLCLVAMGVNYASAAQSQCGPRAEVISQLAKQYHEVPLAVGTINDKVIMELYASVEGTWTYLLSNTDGISCITGAGANFQFDTKMFDKAKPGADS
jgi:hypothetical protein